MTDLSANDFLTLALGLDVQEITDFAANSESEAQKLKKVSLALMHHDGSVFLVEQAGKPTGIFRVRRSAFYELHDGNVIIARKPGKLPVLRIPARSFLPSATDSVPTLAVLFRSVRSNSPTTFRR